MACHGPYVHGKCGTGCQCWSCCKCCPPPKCPSVKYHWTGAACSSECPCQCGCDSIRGVSQLHVSGTHTGTLDLVPGNDNAWTGTAVGACTMIVCVECVEPHVCNQSDYRIILKCHLPCGSTEPLTCPTCVPYTPPTASCDPFAIYTCCATLSGPGSCCNGAGRIEIAITL